MKTQDQSRKQKWESSVRSLLVLCYLLSIFCFASGCATTQTERPVNLKFPPVEYVK